MMVKGECLNNDIRTCTQASHSLSSNQWQISLTRWETNLRGWITTLHWRHNERDDISYHQPHPCLFNRLFRRWSKETSKLRVTGLCERNSPVTGEFPAQSASNAENVSIWWRHHEPRVSGTTWAKLQATASRPKKIQPPFSYQQQLFISRE